MQGRRGVFRHAPRCRGDSLSHSLDAQPGLSTWVLQLHFTQLSRPISYPLGYLTGPDAVVHRDWLEPPHTRPLRVTLSRFIGSAGLLACIHVCTRERLGGHTQTQPAMSEAADAEALTSTRVLRS